MSNGGGWTGSLPWAPGKYYSPHRLVQDVPHADRSQDGESRRGEEGETEAYIDIQLSVPGIHNENCFCMSETWECEGMWACYIYVCARLMPGSSNSSACFHQSGQPVTTHSQRRLLYVKTWEQTTPVPPGATKAPGLLHIICLYCLTIIFFNNWLIVWSIQCQVIVINVHHYSLMLKWSSKSQTCWVYW